jgi:hypothetical protein
MPQAAASAIAEAAASGNAKAAGQVREIIGATLHEHRWPQPPGHPATLRAPPLAARVAWWHQATKVRVLVPKGMSRDSCLASPVSLLQALAQSAAAGSNTTTTAQAIAEAAAKSASPA